MRLVSVIFLLLGTFWGLLFAISVSSASGAWAPDTSYAVGTLETYGDNTYRCLQSHTSQIGWEPPNMPALWELVGTGTPISYAFLPLIMTRPSATPIPPRPLPPRAQDGRTGSSLPMWM